MTMQARALQVANWPDAIAITLADCDPQADDRQPLPAPLRRASPRRRSEFLGGRRSAQESLRRLGYANAATLAIGTDRAPVWPAAYTGSISHSEGLAMAAVAATSAYRAIGVDIQARLSTPRASTLSMRIAGADEWRRASRSHSFEDAATLIWTLKESFYKAISARLRRSIGFLDIEVAGIDAIDAIDAQAGIARLRVDGCVDTTAVLFTRYREHAIALCAIR